LDPALREEVRAEGAKGAREGKAWAIISKMKEQSWVERVRGFNAVALPMMRQMSEETRAMFGGWNIRIWGRLKSPVLQSLESVEARMAKGKRRNSMTLAASAVC
jgi:hypothetical protein